MLKWLKRIPNPVGGSWKEQTFWLVFLLILFATALRPWEVFSACS